MASFYSYTALSDWIYELYNIANVVTSYWIDRHHTNTCMHIIHRNSEVIEFSSSRNINLDSGTTLELVSWFHFLSLHCGIFSYQHALYHVNNLIFLQLFFAAFIMKISHNPDFDEHSRCCKRSREKPFLFGGEKNKTYSPRNCFSFYSFHSCFSPPHFRYYCSHLCWTIRKEASFVALIFLGPAVSMT